MNLNTYCRGVGYCVQNKSCEQFKHAGFDNVDSSSLRIVRQISMFWTPKEGNQYFDSEDIFIFTSNSGNLVITEFTKSL